MALHEKKALQTSFDALHLFDDKSSALKVMIQKYFVMIVKLDALRW